MAVIINLIPLCFNPNPVQGSGGVHGTAFQTTALRRPQAGIRRQEEHLHGPGSSYREREGQSQRARSFSLKACHKTFRPCYTSYPRWTSRWPFQVKGKTGSLRCRSAGWQRCHGGCCRRRWWAGGSRSRWIRSRLWMWPWDTWRPWGTWDQIEFHRHLWTVKQCTIHNERNSTHNNKYCDNELQVGHFNSSNFISLTV